MNFTFKKFLSKTIMKYCIAFIIMATFLLILSFFKDGVGKTIMIALIFLYFIIILSSLIRFLFSRHSFLKEHSKDQIKKIERELANSIFSYDNCFATDKYIFLHQYQRLFNYDDIDKVRVVATFKLRVKSNLFTATLLKLKIYSKGKAYCCFEMDSNNIQFKDVLIDILKVKNPNIKIIDY